MLASNPVSGLNRNSRPLGIPLRFNQIGNGSKCRCCRNIWRQNSRAADGEHVTVVAGGTSFGAPEVKFGSSAVALLVPLVCGPKVAKELLLTGDEQLSAERALAPGIVNHVESAGEEFAKVKALADAMAAVDPTALHMSKRALNRSHEAMGLRPAPARALETAILVEKASGPKRAEFDRTRRERGL